MNLEYGKLYFTNDKIWCNKKWLNKKSVLLFISKTKINEFWSMYKFLHDKQIISFELCDIDNSPFSLLNNIKEINVYQH